MPEFNTWANIPNIATLRTLGGLTLCDQAADVVNVIGYYSPSVTSDPDGGGGTFVYDATDNTTADDGGMVIVDTVGRRWKRQWNKAEVNVRWFGALSTFNANPNAATINLTAIQAAINFGREPYGSFLNAFPALYFPAGVYLIGGTLVSDGQIHWRGDGKTTANFLSGAEGGTSLFWTGSGDYDGLSLYGRDGYCTIDDLELSIDPAATGLHHAISIPPDVPFPARTSSPFSSGGLNRVQFSNWSGCCFYFKVIAGASAYIQDVTMNQISMTNVGGFFGHDATTNPLCNVLYLNDIDLENELNRTVSTRHAFFDFSNCEQIHCTNFLYEPIHANPTLFLLTANTFFSLDFLWTENSNVTNLIEILPPLAGGGPRLDVSNLELVAGPTNSLIFFNGGSNAVVFISSFLNSQATARIVDWGTGSFNYVTIDDFTGFVEPADFSSPNFISKSSATGRTTRGTPNPAAVDPLYFSIAGSSPYINLRGWLDGAYGGPATITAAGATTADMGMFDDANEGRVFEIVSTNNNFPVFTITVTAPLDLVGNQFVMAMRYYLDIANSNFAGFGPWPDFNNLSPVICNTIIPSAILPHNQWRNTYFVAQALNSSPLAIPLTFANPPVGVTKLRIAALYIASGREFPFLVGGATAGKAIQWTAAAAPTYGSYFVGDRVINSVPAVGQPKAWVCTVAGSPGTWVSEGNL